MSASPTIVVTRPEDAARQFAAALRAAGCTAPLLIAPIMTIRALPGAMEAAARALAQACGVILTSANTVALFAAQSRLRPPAWCVGRATAQAAQAEGFDIRAAASDADDLFRVMLGAGTAGPFLQPRGQHARGALAQRLTAAGLPTTEVVIYDQVACPLGTEAEVLLHGSAPVILPLFSPRSARLLAAAVAAVGLPAAPLHLVAISDAAARGWTDADSAPPVAALRIARRPDADAMLVATLAAIAAASIA